jgi:hypothetical protein
MQELSPLQIVYVVVFCLQGGVFLLLNEWLMETDAFTWIADKCRRTARIIVQPPKKQHPKTAAEIVAVVLAIAPFGFNLLPEHPCIAWGLWFASAFLLVYIVRNTGWYASRPLWTFSLIVLPLGALLFFAARSVRDATELDFVFLNPGPKDIPDSDS